MSNTGAVFVNILRHPAVIIVLILLVVLLFGSRRLPDLARSVGQSLKIFKREVKELKDDDGKAEHQASADTTDGASPTGTTSSSATPGTTPNGTSPQVPGLVDPKNPRV
jgi:sec-independent protein translocase protein TatA